jgi:hypothetical protein
MSAAQWIIDRRHDEGGRLIPALRDKFSLTAAEACQACALADRLRSAGRLAS